MRRRRHRPPPDRRPRWRDWSTSRSSASTGRRFRLLDTIRQYAAERLDRGRASTTRVGRAPPRLVPGPGRGARPAVGRPAPLAAHAGDRARQPARRRWPSPCAATRRPPCGWPPRCGASGWTAATSPRATAGWRRRWSPRPSAPRCAWRRCWRAPGCRCAAATRRAYLHRVQAAVADYRELGDEHATAAALYQHAMLEQSVSNTARADALFADAVALAAPARRPATAGGGHPRLGHDAVVPLRPRAGARDRSARRSRSSKACPTTRRRSSTVVTFGLCLLHDGPQGRPRLHLEETIFLFHRFARAQADRLRAQQPGLDGARAGRHGAGPRRRSTRPWSASARSRTARARR